MQQQSVTLKHGEAFTSKRGNLTLPQRYVDANECGCGGETLSRTHKSGWTIEGTLIEDWYVWVTDFKATHPTHGKVVGSFMTKIKATSLEAYEHFIKNHPPEDWNPEDI